MSLIPFSLTPPLSSLSLQTKNPFIHSFMYSSTLKQPCYIEQDNGLASLKDIDIVGHRANNLVTKSMITMGYSNTTSFNNLSLLSSPRSRTSGRFYDTRFEDHQPHFLEACSLCNKSLGDNKDIFMYRGDTPFCSEECRQEQIEIDELKEKNMNLSSSMKALRIKEQRKSNSTNKVQGQDYSFRTGTVIAA